MFILAPFFFLTTSFSLILGPILYKIMKPSLILLIGGFFISSGLYICSFSKTLEAIILFYGVFGSIGFGMSYLVIMNACWEWIPNKKGLVAGVLASGIPFSYFVFS